MRHSLFGKSKCLGKYLHRFRIVEEYPEGVLENCEICHKSIFFKLIDGKVDNRAYMDYHYRQAIPQSHPYYHHEFDYDPLNEIVSPYV